MAAPWLLYVLISLDIIIFSSRSSQLQNTAAVIPVYSSVEAGSHLTLLILVNVPSSYGLRHHCTTALPPMSLALLPSFSSCYALLPTRPHQIYMGYGYTAAWAKFQSVHRTFAASQSLIDRAQHWPLFTILTF